jgi:D-serine deaminase-like pyridoxal phosphate-dependent protein
MRGVNLREVDTPAFLVDKTVVARNCASMHEKATRSGVAFRPHVKTHKCVEIGRMQHAGGMGPITVSTLAEAEFFAQGGFHDITYAVPIAPEKLDRAAALSRQIQRLNLLVDHPATFGAVEHFARLHNVRFDVFLKVDCGYHRAGVNPEDPANVDFAARIAASEFVRFNGLLTHAGHSYNARTRDEILAIAAEETRVLTMFRAQLIEGGRLLRSIGATPTASVVDRFTQCEEVRPGNYVFYDAFQASIGACSWQDCAATVLATIIGVYPDQNKLLIDAGALALSKDLGPTHIHPNFGFGAVFTESLEPLAMRIASISQEHGQVFGEKPIDFARFRIGTRLRIVPNHSCLTAAAYERYFIIENGEVIDQWRPVGGW